MRDEGGQALVEFALVLPLLLVVVTGIIQFGVVFHDYLNLTDAVRAGARAAAVSATSSDPVASARSAVTSSAGGLDARRLGVTVSSTWQSGSLVTVAATYPYSISIFGISVRAGSLASSTTERVE